MKNPLLLLYCTVCYISSILAQPEDLTHDKTFFENQQQQYQRWLDHSGLGWGLKVHAVDVQPQQISLYLKFSTENSDSAYAIWGRLTKDYAGIKTGLKLEQALYFKMLQLMEVRQAVANIQLYDTYDTRREPCFFRGLYSKSGAFQIDSSGCKSKKSDIPFSPSDLGRARKPTVAEFQKQFSQAVVFDKIYAYAKSRYEHTTCENRYPKVGSMQVDGNVLRFEVTDLCKEVLKTEQNNMVCDFLSRYYKPCNWIKREKLTFTFVYQPTDGGFTLKYELDGKVGSGFYDEVGRGGYLDMEIDFDGTLTDYARNFQYDLKQSLLKP